MHDVLKLDANLEHEDFETTNIYYKLKYEF